MHTAIRCLAKVAEEGTDSARIAAATALIEIGTRNGISILEPKDVTTGEDEGGDEGGSAPSSIRVDRSHATSTYDRSRRMGQGYE